MKKEYTKPLTESKGLDEESRDYFNCVCRYLKLKEAQLEDAKIRLVLSKFCEQSMVERLYACLDAGRTPYDAYLLRCGRESCEQCKYRGDCSYQVTKQIIGLAGARYRAFTNGQDKEQFQ